MRPTCLIILIAVCLLLVQVPCVSSQTTNRSYSFHITTDDVTEDVTDDATDDATSDNAFARRLTASIEAPYDALQTPTFTIADSIGNWFLCIGLGEAGYSDLTTAENAHGTCVVLNTDSQRHEFFALSQNALEWQIVLHSPPPSNRLTFPLQTDHIVCFYQDTLTHYERSVMSATRPDSVIGSYAVYQIPESPNGSRQIHKLLHIFRPRAISGGVTVWCDLDITKDSLSITVPAEFLARADYAAGVVIDPTFGFDGVPASEANMPTSAIAFVNTPLTAGDGYVVTELSSHTKVYNGSVTHDMGVYTMISGSADGGALTGGAHQVTLSNTGTRQWNSVSGLSIPLNNGSDYCIACGDPSGTIRIGYDLGGSGEYNNSMCDSTTLPTVWTESGSNRYLFGLRATYTIQPGGSITRRRRTAISDSTH